MIGMLLSTEEVGESKEELDELEREQEKKKEQENGSGNNSGGDKKDKKGDSDPNKPKEVYNSIKDSPNYPEGFEPVKNGTTKNTVKNGELLNELRKVESGTWKKIYKDGYDAYGNEVSIHYFQSESGKVFDVKVKPDWSNGG